jgi:hypothetical protein
MARFNFPLIYVRIVGVICLEWLLYGIDPDCALVVGRRADQPQRLPRPSINAFLV